MRFRNTAADQPVRSRLRLVVPAAVVAAVLGLAAACTSGSTGSPGSAAAQTGSAASQSDPSSSTGASGDVTVPALSSGSSAVVSSSEAPGSGASSPVPTLTSTINSMGLQSDSSTTVVTPTTTSTPPVSITSSPAFGSKNLTPVVPITISVRNAKITKLTMTNPTGKVVTGTIATDGSKWSLGEVLGYGKVYTVVGTAVGLDGKSVPIKGTYTTLPTSAEVHVHMSPGDNVIRGVATSVIVTFGIKNPANRAAIEKNLKITTTPSVVGGWAWIDHDGGYWGVDWRPKNYWPAGTKVHVEANLYGIELSPGQYGSDDVEVTFQIGRSQVTYADAATHEIVVKQGCSGPDMESTCTKTIATYPASFGLDTTPDRVTRSGIYAVMDKQQKVLMTSTKYHYSEWEYWAVRISDNGEFIHENPATVGDQGNTNVSHGCINLSEASAIAYYNSTILGDAVEVTGSSVQLSAADGDDFDWTVPWSEWQRLSALS